MKLSIIIRLLPFCAWFFSAPAAQGACFQLFKRGDANEDGTLDQSDSIAILVYLFRGEGPLNCLDASDADDSGELDISDGIYTLTFLFIGGQPIPFPGNQFCGDDPTADSLGCSSYGGCADGLGLACDDGSCCPEGYFCRKVEGECGLPGLCTTQPDVCEAVTDPVCGCDGQTYENECEANRAGVSVARRGSCEAPLDCGVEPCPRGFFCQTPPGDCGAAGACAEQPTICKKIFKPVCGCDGQTYSNECEAAAAGVSVEHEGACEIVSDCSDPADCGEGSLCLKAEGDCGGAGHCVDAPDACIAVIDPVCGCDGNTYNNECLANRAGASLLHRGPCTE